MILSTMDKDQQVKIKSVLEIVEIFKEFSMRKYKIWQKHRRVC